MKNKLRAFLTFLGLLLIAAALLLAAYNFYESHKAAQTSNALVQSLEEVVPRVTIGDQEGTIPHDQTEIEIPDYILNPNMEMPVQYIDEQKYIGILEVPALGLRLPVMSGWSYANLKTAPCRYTGSAYTGDLIIAAHNYNAHFGGLQDLTENETVVFTDMDGNRFTYRVVEREILEPTDIDRMQAGLWDLTLFTCTVGGARRVTVRCELIL